ncbi:hypothetical protein CC77DRAFT_994099 [Alternaria alternata]|uniref:GST N-terminal domain-containing protein n=1 Tax=Alternaria alternata TaxID=5599 RepID=A0A177DEZ0_ALTAL|nr:hypothetical protein CC77DRAFT_994099 [Alternaria alternata]OAG17710.1 hypothetical protein CC77DRAFT_994099 [Alternaria alternata]
MAGFGRSNSLSINTGGGGLFGNNANQGQQASQPQSSGGLFGSTQQPQQAQSGSLFGGQTQTSQPSSGSLFGNLNKPATTAPASGGLFGSSTAQPTQPQSGGLFGGALGGNTQNQTQNAPQSGGLFGGAQSKPSLFASSTQQTTTPSLFGNNTSTQQNQTSTPSLFGSTQQQAQPQQQNSLFGGTNTQNRSNTLGGSTLGGTQMSSSAQPVQMTLDSIRGTTRFNDLHPEIQNLIQQFDDGIQRKVNYCNQIREALPGSEGDISTIAPDVAYIETILSTVEVGLDNDSANIAHLKNLVKKDADDATLSFRAIENQRLPAQFHYRNNANLTASSTKAPATSALDDDDPTKPVDLMGYFNRRTDELGSTLDVYQRQIREIEAHLRTMEAGTMEKAQQLTGSRSAPRDQRRELVEALKAIEGAILDSAKKVGKVKPGDKSGEFKRQTSVFRNWIQNKPGAEFPPEKGRYHLYVSYACPWAHRTLIVRHLKGLEDIISYNSVHWHMAEKGWRFATPDEQVSGNTTPDPLHNEYTHLRDIYFEQNPDYEGRFTVPTLYDKKAKKIVSNESAEIIRMLYTEFDDIIEEKHRKVDLFPKDLQKDIEAMNDWVYNDVNNGVYKSGFATTEEAYTKAVTQLFKSLDRLEESLSKSSTPYLLSSPHVTEADIRLFTTIIRFDPVYVQHFKCNIRDIRSGYPLLHQWMRHLYWDYPAFKETTDFEHIKKHYTKSHGQINKFQITPIGPVPDILEKEDEVPSVKAVMNK